MTLPDGVKDITLRINKMKRKCKTCLYYFNGVGANPCESCKKFNNYQEKSMEKNEKFEEWIYNEYGVEYSKIIKDVSYSLTDMQDSFEAGQDTWKDQPFVGIREDLTSLESVNVTCVGHKISKTPNCQLCKWREVNNTMIGFVSHCGAIAGRSLDNVYNNEQCQALYEVEDSDD